VVLYRRCSPARLAAVVAGLDAGAPSGLAAAGGAA
jgi:hypothetical protein